MSSWWTEERVSETVTPAYVHAHLRPNEQELLQRALYFGGDLTDDTYLDWILTRARRLFLILVATGVPDQIFGVVDDSYDDEDLPIVEQAVPDLRLSYKPDRALDKRFYRNQFRFLTRIVGEGEHIRYADEETVPAIPLGLKSVVLSLSHEGTDKVRFPSDNPKVFVRRRIALEAPLTEDEILNEIASHRTLCHEHIVSVYGSYLYQGTFNVLSLPAAEWSLKTFLSDTPKSFSALPKVQRRQTLINWPHCLASALIWLHGNGEFHGAIRPSNIQVDESFHISLGLLDGEGMLRDRAPSNDIEAYQYGPPERWKRAVTVQSTGSGAAVSLPSGGRSGRRFGGGANQGRDRLDGSDAGRCRSASSGATYTFQPASRGNYARLRLSAALGPDARPETSHRGVDVASPTDHRSVNSQVTTRRIYDPVLPTRAPSLMSSNGSNGVKADSILRTPMFVSAPEGRSAVVQTWKSVEQDMFASDIFSLGAIVIDILNLLCKRSYGAFCRHRSSKNRMAGRGGGLADASFHANLGQVLSWAQSLQKEAEKKAKKDESQVLHAVGPVVQLALQCLERDPQARLTSDQLGSKLGDYTRRFAGIKELHCSRNLSKEEKDKGQSLPVRGKNSAARTVREIGSVDGLRQPSPDPRTITQEWRQQQQHLILPDAQIWQPLNSHPPRSVYTTPGATSTSSLTSFNFDGLSDTVVNEGVNSREQSLHGPRRRREAARPPLETPWSADQGTGTLKQPYWHNNDSQVDPRLSFGDSTDAGAFTYLNYSTSASSDEGARGFPRPPVYHMPPRAPPTRELPPVPPRATKSRSSKVKARVPPLQPPGSDLAMLSQLAKAGGDGRPMRVDSLPRALDDDRVDDDDDDNNHEDYHEALWRAKRTPVPKTSSRERGRPRVDQYDIRREASADRRQ